jgi:hypothetical protein
MEQQQAWMQWLKGFYSNSSRSSSSSSSNLTTSAYSKRPALAASKHAYWQSRR